MYTVAMEVSKFHNRFDFESNFVLKVIYSFFLSVYIIWPQGLVKQFLKNRLVPLVYPLGNLYSYHLKCHSVHGKKSLPLFLITLKHLICVCSNEGENFSGIRIAKLFNLIAKEKIIWNKINYSAVNKRVTSSLSWIIRWSVSWQNKIIQHLGIGW